MRRLLGALISQAQREPAAPRVIDADRRPWTNADLVRAIAAVRRVALDRCPRLREARDAHREGEFPPVLLVTCGSGGAFWVGMLAATSLGCDALPIASATPRGMRERIDRELGPAGEIDAEWIGEAVLSASRPASAAPHELAELDDRASPFGGVVLVSSGTTGRSRFVRRRPETVEQIAEGLVRAGLYAERDEVGSFLPMHHAYGFEHAFVAPLLAGARVRHGITFSASATFEMLGDGVTVLPTVPPAASMLAEQAWPAHTLRAIITAGSPLRAAVRARIADASGVEPVDLYGATELGTIWLDRGHGGVPIDGVAVCIADPTRRDVVVEMPDGEQGEVLVRSRTSFQAFRGAAAGEEGLIDGWFRTADLGRRRADGTLVLTGRAKLVFDVGGLKVNPYDVESALEEHPEVRVALVEPIQLDEGLARVAATVELADPSRMLDASTLRAFAAERLPAHAVPRSITFVRQLGRTASGKVLRTRSSADDATRACSPVEVRPEHLTDRERREAWTRDLFDRTAAGYDASSGAAFFGVGRRYRRRMLLSCGLRRGMSHLDVGSGTGLCAWIGQQIVGAEGRAVALDPSAGMLAVAAARGVRETRIGQAEHLPFPDRCFDLVSMSYMLRHIEDLHDAFREARRVLRPLGRLLILELTKPEGPVAGTAFRLAMRHVVPAWGVLASRRMSTFRMMRYWGETIDVAVRPELIVSAIEAAGFVGVRHARELGVFSSYRGVAGS